MTVQAPKNKAEFYRRWHAGEFGNRPQSWPDFHALRESGWYHGQLVSAMPHERGGKIYVGKSVDEIRRGNGGTLQGLMFMEPVPNHLNRLVGEVSRSCRGFELLYSTERNVTVRDARGSGSNVHGLESIGLLRYGLGPSDFDWLMELFNRFPDAAIEFSAFDCFVGVVPRSNTIIWEVREY